MDGRRHWRPLDRQRFGFDRAPLSDTCSSGIAGTGRAEISLDRGDAFQAMARPTARTACFRKYVVMHSCPNASLNSISRLPGIPQPDLHRLASRSTVGPTAAIWEVERLGWQLGRHPGDRPPALR